VSQRVRIVQCILSLARACTRRNAQELMTCGMARSTQRHVWQKIMNALSFAILGLSSIAGTMQLEHSSAGTCILHVRLAVELKEPGVSNIR